MKALLVSTYELGRQPFGLASPAARLRQQGVDVTCVDTAVEPLKREIVQAADLIALYIPMHTATRLAAKVVPAIRALNPRAHLCCYGLYAPLNETYLRNLGIQTLLGGEFEDGLAALCRQLQGEGGNGLPLVSVARQTFRVPDRHDLPPLSRYAQLIVPGGQPMKVGYTEASRGCKHLCRHCPVVPVYNGQFRVVPVDIVLADIQQQIAAGASHITFGDPDFFNGPGHAMRLVRSLHDAFPDASYDVTIKVSHLLKHRQLLPSLQATGCILVTTAAEAVDDHTLKLLGKGHTAADFAEAVDLCRQAGLNLNPTFVPFTPWTSAEGYRVLLRTVSELGLVENVAPIQYAIRLLLPAGSRLLAEPALEPHLGAFDEAALSTTWIHPDPRMDRLQATLMTVINDATQAKRTRREVFAEIWRTTERILHDGSQTTPGASVAASTPIPFLSEPWYC